MKRQVVTVTVTVTVAVVLVLVLVLVGGRLDGGVTCDLLRSEDSRRAAARTRLVAGHVHAV